MCGDVLQCGIRGEMEAGHLFASVVPVRAQGENSGLRPDARLAVDMPRDIYRLPPVPQGVQRSAREMEAARRMRRQQPPPGNTHGLELLCGTLRPRTAALSGTCRRWRGMRSQDTHSPLRRLGLAPVWRPKAGTETPVPGQRPGLNWDWNSQSKLMVGT